MQLIFNFKFINLGGVEIEYGLIIDFALKIRAFKYPDRRQRICICNFYFV